MNRVTEIEEKLNGISLLLFYIGIYAFFFLFYYKAYPLIPFDTDDWGNMSLERAFYPEWKGWNPIKILPECLYYYSSLFASRYLILITKNYLHSLVMMNAMVVSLFITIYAFSFQKLLDATHKHNLLVKYSLVLSFLLIHFLALRNGNSANDYLLYSRDVTCFYHYVIPNLFCSSLVMWLMHVQVPSFRRPFAFVIAFSLFYFAIFSNLFCSIILIAYLCAVMINDYYNQNQLRVSVGLLRGFVEKRWEVIILGLWLISLFFEKHGGRAGNLDGFGAKNFGLLDNLTALLTIQCDWIFLFICAVVMFIIVWKRFKFGPISDKTICLLISFCITFAFVFLLSARASYTPKTAYIKLPMVFFSFSFYVILGFVLGISFLIKKNVWFVSLVPSFFLYLSVDMETGEKMFKDVARSSKMEIDSCAVVDRMMIDEVKSAAQNGYDSVFVRVPFYGGANWPLLKSASTTFGRTLYLHKQIDVPICTQFVPDEKLQFN